MGLPVEVQADRGPLTGVIERARQETIRYKAIGTQWFSKPTFCRPSAPAAATIDTAEVLVCVGLSEIGFLPPIVKIWGREPFSWLPASLTKSFCHPNATKAGLFSAPGAGDNRLYAAGSSLAAPMVGGNGAAPPDHTGRNGGPVACGAGIRAGPPKPDITGRRIFSPHAGVFSDLLAPYFASRPPTTSIPGRTQIPHQPCSHRRCARAGQPSA